MKEIFLFKSTVILFPQHPFSAQERTLTTFTSQSKVFLFSDSQRTITLEQKIVEMFAHEPEKAIKVLYVLVTPEYDRWRTTLEAARSNDSILVGLVKRLEEECTRDLYNDPNFRNVVKEIKENQLTPCSSDVQIHGQGWRAPENPLLYGTMEAYSMVQTISTLP